MRSTFKRTAALVALGAAGMACAQAPDWAKVRIGVEGNYPPFSQLTPDGKLEGFDIDIAMAVCAQMKAECTLVKQEWDGMIPALNARKFDMIVASMSITPERREKVDFSDSYYDIKSSFVAKKGSVNDVSPAALKGKKIIVLRNSPRAKYVADNYPGNEVLLVTKEADATMELAAGRGDIALVSLLAATPAFLKSPEGAGYGKVGAPICPSGCNAAGGNGIAMRKGEDTLREKVNAALKAITDNGTYKKINEKYFEFSIRGL